MGGTAGDSRWLRTACHCLVVCSWQLTLHWCRQCKVTENPPGVRLTEMVWLSGALADARSKRTPNRARLVVLGLVVGGRWSKEARVFVQLLARARARSEPPVIQRRMEQAWRLRWLSIISCTSFCGFLVGVARWSGCRQPGATIPRGGT